MCHKVKIIYTFIHLKLAIQQCNAHKKREKRQKKNKTYDTKKQCPEINIQSKTHEENTKTHDYNRNLGPNLVQTAFR